MTEEAASISPGVAGRFKTFIKRSSTNFESSVALSTKPRIELAWSEMAIPSVGPLTRAMIEPNRNSLDLSHSHALSRGGRPRLFKKPSGRPASASASEAARAPGFIPGSFDTEPVTI